MLSIFARQSVPFNRATDTSAQLVPFHFSLRAPSPPPRCITVVEYIISKRQRITLRLLYAIGRPSVVCLSVVCDVGAPYSGG